ncbi:hypothetical protein AAFF_G00162070 [Aldrovandia affinis]|uniref:Uncharacterized protein n=1 Tax=Aldrovandia affinis TaxID=143900 RepID=A0AAD7W880_9TELE|nr:hypothetical protein AAFF_G00162070 [Aldrovandia affinis]
MAASRGSESGRWRPYSCRAHHVEGAVLALQSVLSARAGFARQRPGCPPGARWDLAAQYCSLPPGTWAGEGDMWHRTPCSTSPVPQTHALPV